MTTPLEIRIRAMIEKDGPMPVDKFMALCLTDPEDGYYRSIDPLGAAGDFTTAPEISQMFGELVGLWLYDEAIKQGVAAEAALVELGPGRGTLIKIPCAVMRVLRLNIAGISTLLRSTRH